MEVEARAVRGGHGEVGQQRAVVEVHQREETVVQTQAQQELQPRSGPQHPEGQEGQRQQGAISGEGLEPLQHHLWSRDLRAGPGPENRTKVILLTAPETGAVRALMHQQGTHKVMTDKDKERLYSDVTALTDT